MKSTIYVPNVNIQNIICCFFRTINRVHVLPYSEHCLKGEILPNCRIFNYKMCSNHCSPEPPKKENCKMRSENGCVDKNGQSDGTYVFAS